MEIPGFYYDQAKKKYFKIEKNAFNSADNNPYKEETIKKRKMLDKIKADVSDYNSRLISNYKQLCLKDQNFVTSIYQREIGLLPMNNFSKMMLLNQGSEMTLKSFSTTDNLFDSGNSSLQNILYHPNWGVILHLQNIVTSSFVLCRKFKKNLNHKLKFKSKTLNCTAPIMNGRSLRFLNGSEHKLCLLEYISDKQTDQDKSYLTFISPDRGDSRFIVNRYGMNHFGRCVSFTPIYVDNTIFCSYNSALELITVDNTELRPLKWRTFNGKEKRKFLTVELLGDQSLSRNILVGSRDHGIHLYDMRQPRFTNNVPINSSDKGICKVTSVPDNDHQFISASFEGKIRLWDIRNATRCCLIYHKGIENSFTTPPLCVDPASRYLVATGENCAIHLWNLKCGDLIKLINPIEFLNESQLSLHYRPHPQFCPPLIKGQTNYSAIMAFSSQYWVYYS